MRDVQQRVKRLRKAAQSQKGLTPEQRQSMLRAAHNLPRLEERRRARRIQNSVKPPMGGSVAWKQAAATINELFQAAIRADKFGELDTMIAQVCALTRFAPWNAFLIAVQRPGALAVATPRDWAENYQRAVIPGARPIVILQPFGPVAFLYELKDTIGKAHPRLDDADPFAVKQSGPVLIAGEDVGLMASALLRRDRIQVRWEELGGAKAGSALRLRDTDKANVTLGNEGAIAFLIRLAHWQSPPMSLVTLFHELAHIYCGHIGTPMVVDPKTGRPRPSKWDDRRGELSLGQREFEAECTAYMVASRIGLETKSAEYLASYICKDDADAISVAHIVFAMSRIENLSPKRLLPNRRQIYQRRND